MHKNPKCVQAEALSSVSVSVDDDGAGRHQCQRRKDEACRLDSIAPARGALGIAIRATVEQTDRCRKIFVWEQGDELEGTCSAHLAEEAAALRFTPSLGPRAAGAEGRMR